MDLAGDIINALATFLNIEELPVRCHRINVNYLNHLFIRIKMKIQLKCNGCNSNKGSLIDSKRPQKSKSVNNNDFLR